MGCGNEPLSVWRRVVEAIRSGARDMLGAIASHCLSVTHFQSPPHARAWTHLREA